MADKNSADPSWYLNRQRKVRFDESEFRSFLQRLSREVARGREFAVVVGSDDALRRANRVYRGKRTTTDVLSFPDGDGGRLGDILISAGQAQRQAERFDHRIEDEFKVLVLHGVLHLLGYDHETDNGRMRRAETRWRRKFGLPAGVVERVEK